MSATVLQVVHGFWTTHTAFPFPPSLQALDANDGVINARQLHPLFGVVASGPGGAINTDVPNASLRSLSPNNFHRSTRRLDAASNRSPRTEQKNKKKDRLQNDSRICQMNKRKQRADRGSRVCSN